MLNSIIFIIKVVFSYLRVGQKDAERVERSAGRPDSQTVH